MNFDDYLQEVNRFPNSVLLETTKSGNEENKTLLFQKPVDIIQTRTLDGLHSAFVQIEKNLAKGFYVAGYLSYECGYYFEELKSDTSASFPLLWFGVYHEPVNIVQREEQEKKQKKAPTIITHETSEGFFSNIRFSIAEHGSEVSPADYEQCIDRIKHYIKEGDIYQVNFTGRMKFGFDGSPIQLYHSLKRKQPVGYAAYIRTDEQTILSFSPELFFRRTGDTIMVRPMKGTARRGRTVKEDELIKTRLAADKKNKAELVMIVDVLRNDVGKIAQVGSVRTASLYDIEKYETLFQTTSTVEATLQKGVSYFDIFKALFPSGSITGAPKRRAMEIIRQLESTPRGVYTGAIGYFSPKNEAVFNVAIRTVVLTPDSSEQEQQANSNILPNAENFLEKRYLGEMGTGGGIVWDSKAEDELHESKLKAEFLTLPQGEIKLIETMLWHNGIALLNYHIERLKSSCEYFDFPFDERRISKAIHSASRRKREHTDYKFRLTLDRQGDVFIETSIIENNPSDKKLYIRLAEQRTYTSDRFLYHKTTMRDLYDEASSKAMGEGIADYIFLNERGEITEGAISNIFVRQGEQYLTPPVECGLLNGVYRRHLLAILPNTTEKILHVQDLMKADSIYICNSLRGLREVWLKK